ncbi:MAG: hypothetical protein ACRDSN_22100, partial [Pseudonocardiaceae bacterium]
FARLSPNRRQALDTEQEAIRRAVGTTPLSLDEWRGRLHAKITERSAAFLRRQRIALQAHATEWVEQVQAVVCAEVRRSIAADGLDVTGQLVRAVIDDLEQEVSKLDGVALQDDEAAKGFASELAKAIGAEPVKRFWRSKQLFPAEHNRVQVGLERGVEAALGRAQDAMVRRLSARLLRDFTNNLLKPMSTELARGLHALRRDTTPSADGRSSLIGQWPQGPGYPVPGTLRPSRTQFLVDDIEDYPSRFIELITAAVPSAVLPGDAVSQAIRMVLVDDWERDGEAVVLLGQTASWQPETVREWSRLERVEQAAAFRIRVTGEELVTRCEAWALQSQGLGAYLRQTLAEA